MHSLEERIRSLSPGLQREVSQFLDELEKKHANRPARYLRQDWAGGLSDLKDQYTALGLQKQAVQWWRETD